MIDKINHIINAYITPLIVFVVCFGLGTLGVLKALEILDRTVVCSSQTY